jgi:molecular chaperone GrpE
MTRGHEDSDADAASADSGSDSAGVGSDDDIEVVHDDSGASVPDAGSAGGSRPDAGALAGEMADAGGATAEDDAEGSGFDLSGLESFLSGTDEMKVLAAQRDEYLDSLRRLQADFDNYRKRAIRQQTELVERSTEGLLVRLLPVLDALDLATAHLPAAGKGNDSDAMKSLTQIGTLLRDVLEREGLERIDQVGVPFDPTIHDAVAQTTAEAGNGDNGADAAPNRAAGAKAAGARPGHGSVADVMRSGYRLKSRVLRPAMVAVQS